MNSEYGSNIGYYDVGGIEERKVKNLKKIMDATGAVVVICSRANDLMGKEFNSLRINEIKKYGVEPLDSITDFYFDESKAEPIKRWLKKNNSLDAKIVVIDDCKDNLDQEFRNCFIHIKGKHGLTLRYVIGAIAILE